VNQQDLECFILTLAGIFNILAYQDLCLQNQKRIINIMPKVDSPYIDNSGTIIIPFTADGKYHYWNGGQSMADTLMELNASEDIWKNHTEKPYKANVARAEIAA
jgi:hypothetical protein